MSRFILVLFMLPWWAYLPMAGGIAYLSEGVYQRALEDEAMKAAALETDPPALVDIAAFSRAEHMSDAEEINVSGWINTDYNYQLVKKINGVTTSKRFMFVLFGEDDSRDSKVARGAIVLTEAERETFIAQLDQRMLGYSANGIILALNGFAGSGDGYSSLVADSLRDEGLTKGENFVYVEPFFDGREAALAPHGAPEKGRRTAWMVAAGVALFGLAKLLFKRRKAAQAGKAAPFADGPIAGGKRSQTYQPMATPQPQAVVSKNVMADSPLGRIAHRREEQRAQEGSGSVPSLTAEKADTRGRTQRHWPMWQKLALIAGLLNVGFILAGKGSAILGVLPIIIFVVLWLWISGMFRSSAIRVRAKMAADPLEKLSAEVHGRR